MYGNIDSQLTPLCGPDLDKLRSPQKAAELSHFAPIIQFYEARKPAANARQATGRSQPGKHVYLYTPNTISIVVNLLFISQIEAFYACGFAIDSQSIVTFMGIKVTSRKHLSLSTPRSWATS